MSSGSPHAPGARSPARAGRRGRRRRSRRASTASCTRAPAPWPRTAKSGRRRRTARWAARCVKESACISSTGLRFSRLLMDVTPGRVRANPNPGVPTLERPTANTVFVPAGVRPPWRRCGASRSPRRTDTAPGSCRSLSRPLDSPAIPRVARLGLGLGSGLGLGLVHVHVHAARLRSPV